MSQQLVPLAQIDNPRAAQAFVDYLLLQGVLAELKLTPEQKCQIWVELAAQRAAKEWFEEFIQSPDDPKYLSASWQTGQQNSALSYSGKPLNLMSRFFKLDLLSQTVFVLCLIVYLLAILGFSQTIYPLLSFIPDNPVTWLTPALLHFSAMHLIFNLAAWLYFAPKIQQTLNSKILSVLVVLAAIAGHWAQFIVIGANFGGLSGIVYGLVGFCWWYGWKTPGSALAVPRAIIGFMLVWLMLGFADILFFSMANWAHLGGLVTGCALGYISARRSAR